MEIVWKKVECGHGGLISAYATLHCAFRQFLVDIITASQAIVRHVSTCPVCIPSYRTFLKTNIFPKEHSCPILDDIKEQIEFRVQKHKDFLKTTDNLISIHEW